MAFLLIAAPKTNGTLPVDSLGGTGIFTAIAGGDLLRGDDAFLKAHNIGIRLPDQVPPMIKNSFDIVDPGAGGRADALSAEPVYPAPF